MLKFALLTGAIVTEVTAILSLRASQDHWAWLILVAVGYLTSFAMLTLLLRAGMPIGVTYGIWGAVGTALTAILAAVIFGDPFTVPIVFGIGLIIIGVLLVEFGSQRAIAARAEHPGAMTWVLLFGAIVSEVAATLSMRASDGFRKRIWVIPVVIGYLISFGLLKASLSQGMPVGIAYGVWSACGVALVALLAKFLFAEPLTWMMGAGIAFIIGGVLTIQLIGPVH